MAVVGLQFVPTIPVAIATQSAVGATEPYSQLDACRWHAMEEDMLFAEPFPTEAAASTESTAAASDWLKSMGQRVGAFVTTCADYWSAAALYDELRGLSDAELRRRGLSRGTLGRDVCEVCDRMG